MEGNGLSVNVDDRPGGLDASNEYILQKVHAINNCTLFEIVHLINDSFPKGTVLKKRKATLIYIL